MQNRREFVKEMVAGAAVLGAGANYAWGEVKAGAKSRVVIVRDAKLRTPGPAPDEKRVAALLDHAMQTYFNAQNPVQPWKQIVRPGQVVGLKLNSLGSLQLQVSYCSGTPNSSGDCNWNSHLWTRWRQMRGWNSANMSLKAGKVLVKGWQMLPLPEDKGRRLSPGFDPEQITKPSFKLSCGSASRTWASWQSTYRSFPVHLLDARQPFCSIVIIT